jgi:asparagine synthase (glutamine-hydrolysing)
MSVLVGFRHFEESASITDETQVLRSALPAHGCVGVKVKQPWPVAMGYATLATAFESDEEMQPLDRSGVLLTWDGRLDNKSELQKTLTGTLDPMSDSEVVLLAYLRWGRDFVRYLLGEFALALWDSNRHLLMLGRDAFGIRPLFYHANDQRIVWASQIQALLKLPCVPAAVDDEFVAGFLVCEPSPENSPFRDIHPVPAAHVLLSSGGTLRTIEYWRIDAKKEIRYRSDCEYEEHFRCLFREAVRCRLKGQRNVVAELSGGLDSSSITCMANSILAEEQCSVQGLETVSFIADESESFDESRYIGVIESHIKRRCWHIRESESPVLGKLDPERSLGGPAPQQVLEDYWLKVKDVMQRTASQILISGHGGDHVLVGDVRAPFELADCARSFQLSELIKKCRQWGGTWPLGPLLWRGAVWPCLPRVIRRRTFRPSPPQWLSSSFNVRWNIRDRMLGPAEVETYGFSRPSAREVYGVFRSMIGAFSSGYSEGYYSTFGITRTYPFLHKPLVEFMIAIPLEQNITFRTEKSLLRRSMRGLLPDQVRLRRSKSVFDEVFIRAFARQWPHLRYVLENPLVCDFGYADPKVLRGDIARARHGFCLEPASFLRLLAVEMWLRSLQRWKTEHEEDHAHIGNSDWRAVNAQSVVASKKRYGRHNAVAS